MHGQVHCRIIAGTCWCVSADTFRTQTSPYQQKVFGIRKANKRDCNRFDHVSMCWLLTPAAGKWKSQKSQANCLLLAALIYHVHDTSATIHDGNYSYVLRTFDCCCCRSWMCYVHIVLFILSFLCFSSRSAHYVNGIMTFLNHWSDMRRTYLRSQFNGSSNLEIVYINTFIESIFAFVYCVCAWWSAQRP